MDIENTTEPEVQNQVESETPKKTESQTDEDINPQPVEGDGNVEKESQEIEEDFYAQEAKRLESELAEKKRQLELKDRALQAEKKKRKVESSGVVDEDALIARLESRQAEKEAKKMIDTLLPDANARKVVEHAYDNFIVKSGNAEDDIHAAIAYANRKRVVELLRAEKEDEVEEDRAISSMAGVATRPSRSTLPKSVLRREVEKLIPKDAKKHLDKYIPR